MAESEEGTFGRVGEAFDLPAVGEDDLLHDGEAKAGPVRLGGEVGFEDLGALFRGDTGAVVAHFQERLGGAGTAGDDLDLAAGADGLNGIEQEIEQGLPEELLVGLDGDLGVFGVELNLFILDVDLQGTDDFGDHGADGEGGAPDLDRKSVV